MHPDRKIGVAMGILLVGVVAALFFRNEPLQDDGALTVRRERELNDRLRERDVAVYLDSDEPAPEAAEDDPSLRLEEILAQNPATRSTPVPVLRDGMAVGTTPASTPPVTQPPLRFEPPTDTIRTTDDGESESDGDAAVASSGTSSSSGPTSPEPTSAQKARQVEYQEYTVQFGDTLSEISEKFLGSQGRYREIYEANKDRMASPDRLQVGKAIRIPRVIR
ncbi:LysM peptidoglycan-binding domain-containing protein [Fuerstiella marisgermanici]|uniref:LysM domain/BON superfamily protein n=1 Tax=Fuerstiella marisgermanici TaxID=1891926 RepID=A0A1P8WSI9_9PLAN|nr:LysM peptidoglycan-binding domain-containing protein [Fuerstiella marisgermanici]APZ97020.1 LysM domain/BON superfamily protein [Fuerstiella marisgermanici]